MVCSPGSLHPSPSPPHTAHVWPGSCPAPGQSQATSDIEHVRVQAPAKEKEDRLLACGSERRRRHPCRWRAEKAGRTGGTAAHFSKQNSRAWSCLEAAGSSLRWREAEGDAGKEAGLYTLRQNSSHQRALWFLEKPCPWRTANVCSELSQGQASAPSRPSPVGQQGAGRSGLPGSIH